MTTGGTTGPATWLAAVRDAERRGELLAAFDLAGRGLEEHPTDVELRYRSVLALARAGSTAQAELRFAQLDLASVASEDVSRPGRPHPEGPGPGRHRRRPVSTGRTGGSRLRDGPGPDRGYFPAINAATLTLVAGDPDTSRALATEALVLVERTGETGYFAAATEAEARLLLGDRDGTRAALVRAAALADGDFGALSTTRRQLRTVCTELGIDPDILSPLSGPAVAHFCGHLMAAPGNDGRFRSDDEERVAAEAARACDRQPIGFAYGSLASGGDILWAEALLARGAELHVVLPFAQEEFVRTSVSAAGGDWAPRFHRCLAAASSVRYATEDAYLGDDVLYAYGAALAMGLALLRARYLDADVFQLALWDGQEPTGPAGTAADVALWRTTGHDTVVVAPAARPRARRPGQAWTRRTTPSTRTTPSRNRAVRTTRRVTGPDAPIVWSGPC